MSQCVCRTTTGLKAFMIHDLSSLPMKRLVLISLCEECVKNLGFYCEHHQTFKICVTPLPREVYAVHPELLQTACHKCVLNKQLEMDAHKKERFVALLDSPGNPEIIASYIPMGDRGLFKDFNTKDFTLFGLLMSAELGKMSPEEMVRRILAEVQTTLPERVH